jgi:hypothetical protein
MTNNSSSSIKAVVEARLNQKMDQAVSELLHSREALEAVLYTEDRVELMSLCLDPAFKQSAWFVMRDILDTQDPLYFYDSFYRFFSDLSNDAVYDIVYLKMRISEDFEPIWSQDGRGVEYDEVPPTDDCRVKLAVRFRWGTGIGQHMKTCRPIIEAIHETQRREEAHGRELFDIDDDAS